MKKSDTQISTIFMQLNLPREANDIVSVKNVLASFIVCVEMKYVDANNVDYTLYNLVRENR